MSTIGNIKHKYRGASKQGHRGEIKNIVAHRTMSKCDENKNQEVEQRKRKDSLD